MATFDHIVIGSGSGGSAVAARLSEDPTVTVLLIEAGGSDRRLDVRAPAAFPSQFHSKIDWDYFTEPAVAHHQDILRRWDLSRRAVQTNRQTSNTSTCQPQPEASSNRVLFIWRSAA
jgi:choline dehydrogenase-like flavoprotein